jgi:hypothetical protein
MKEIVIKFKLNGAEQSIKNINELKQSISTLENNLNSAEFGTKAFERQKNQLDELKDKYSEVSKTAGDKAKEASEKAMGAADNFEKFAKGLVDAFSGVAIAIGASDEDTKKMMETFMKFQGIATGVKGGIEAVMAVTKSWSAIQEVLNAVLFANPIGLIVLGVAALAGGIYLLIKNIDTVIEFFSDWTNAVLVLLGPIGWLIIAYRELTDLTTEQSNSTKKLAQENYKAYKAELAQITKTKEARIKAADTQIEALNLEKDTLDANGQMSDAVTVKILEAELEKTKAVFQANEQRLQAAIDYYTKQARLAGLSDEEFKKQMKARGVDLDKAQDEYQAMLDKNHMAVQYAENAITKFKREQAEERTADAKDEFDRLKQIHEDSFVEVQKMYKNTINTIPTSFEIVEKKASTLYNTIAAMGAQAAIDAENKRKKDLADQLADAQRKIGIAKSYSDAVNSLTEGVFALSNRFGKQDEEAKEKRAKRQFAINKALALSSAIIDGFKAITTSLAESPLAIGVIPNPVGIANLIATAAMTAANIAKIASSQYKSSASGGSASPASSMSSPASSVSSNNVSTPTFNSQTLFSSGANRSNVSPFGQSTQSQNQNQPLVIQNTISAAEMTTVQNDLAGIQSMATFSLGGG